MTRSTFRAPAGNLLSKGITNPALEAGFFFFGRLRARFAKHWHTLALLGVLGAVGALFACGLPGGFVLDDYANLHGLEKVGNSPLRGALYLIDVPSRFPGRPLSYLTFLFQHASWPGDPAAFKVVNIILHLFNGVLVYAIAARLLALRRDGVRTWVPLVAAGLWLVHPIQISTVLYVVQRMAQLATLLCFGGLLAYLTGRRLALSGRTLAGYVWMSAALCLGTGFGVLAKENGALLPLLVAVVEFALLASVARPPRWNLWAAIFLALPTLVLAAYIAWGPGSPAAYFTRTFDLPQRLYTEAGIMWNYVWKIALPRPLALGIYFDDYPVAAPPWVAFSTAAAMAGWCAAFAASLFWRRKLPFLSFAILWFLAGHVLESSVIPLELYFEHRNYLPLFGPALAIAWGLSTLWQRASSATTRRIYASLALPAVLALGSVTWIEARAWADPVRQTVLWAREHPTSMRAQYELGTAYIAARKYTEAAATFERAEALAPQDAQFILTRFILGCERQELAMPSITEVAHHLASTPVRPGMVNLLDSLVDRLEEGTCSRVDASTALKLADAFLSNPKALQFRGPLLHQKARLHAVERNLDSAVRTLEAADEIAPNLMSVYLQVAWLASADLYGAALRAIKKGRADPRWSQSQRALYAAFFDGWERQVRAGAAHKGVRLEEGA